MVVTGKNTKTMKTNTKPSAAVIAAQCIEFANARKKNDHKIVRAIEKALAGFEYNVCRCTCLEDDRLHYIDVDDIHRVVNVIRLSPIEKQGATLTKNEVVMLADPIAGDPEYSDTELLRLETCDFDPLDVLETIGKVIEYNERSK